VAHDRIQCPAVVNTIMKLRISFIKGWEFLVWLNDYELLTKDSVPWT
jgi:hypothetical protein